ncbi:MAG: cobalamin adenosyltransferase [Clostridia bacterium]|nr:cobalamin adenosyltransferase [Clostridia bacterium]
MAVITEQKLKTLFDEGKISSVFKISEEDVLTPSAREFLKQNSIEVEIGAKFDTVFGFSLSKKPEQMTHLHEGFLVPKNHPRIVFRGRLDSLESEIILVQVEAKEMGMTALCDDLEEIIRLIRKIIQCEVKDLPLGDFTLQGLDDKALREHSHHPSKYYGMHHFLPTYKHGKIVACLNRLRTLTRETEIFAFSAFEDEFHNVSHRTDIIMALNRLSSLFFVMMFKVLTDKYGRYNGTLN